MKNKFLVLLLLSSWLPAMTQIPEPLKIVPAPNAYSFQEYGQNSVSHFTGLPSIKVNLANLSVQRQNAVPMSLSYSASGFRPDVHPSWVGTNWNLDLGGVVTRQVKGLPDEFSYYMENICDCLPGESHSANATYNLGFTKTEQDTGFNLNTLLKATNSFINLDVTTTQSNWVRFDPPIPYKGHWFNNSCFSWQSAFAGNFLPAYMAGNDELYLGTRDIQSDEYSFNMFGHSGKFYFKSPTEIEVISDKKYTAAVYGADDDLPAGLLAPNMDPQAGSTCVNWLLGYSPWKAYNRYPKTFSGFRITAEDGTIFDFGNRFNYLNATDYSIGENYNPGQNGHGSQRYWDYWKATSWYLSAVTFPDGQRKVFFEYERGEYNRAMFLSEFAYSVLQNNDGCSLSGANFSLPGNLRQSTIVSPVYLSRIYSDLLDVRLYYSNTNETTTLLSNALLDFKWKKLDSIQYKDNEGNAGVWKFAYFPLADYGQRLFLSEVEKYSPTGNPNGEKYRFLYDTSLALPDYLQGQTDHWGFWNGINTLSVYGKTNAGLDTLRKPVLANTRAGVLTHIFYPTGGYSKFQFEQNTYSKRVKMDRSQGVESAGGNKDAGGLRIRSIRNVDTIGNTERYTEFFYVNGYSPGLTDAQITALPSSGVHNLNNFTYHWTDQFMQMDQLPVCLRNLKVTLLSNQPLNPVFDDYHVGYTTVVARQWDSSYQVYSFSNHDNGFTDTAVDASFNAWPSPYNEFSARNQERGNLLEEATYLKSGKILQRVTNTYHPVGAYSSDNPRTFFKRISLNILDATNQNRSDALPMPASYIVSSLIRQYSYWMKPARTRTVTWATNSTDSSVHVVEYAYDNAAHGQVTGITTYESGGAISRQILKYPHDYSSEAVLASIKDIKGFNTVIEKISTSKDSPSDTEMVTGAALSEYALNPHEPYSGLSMVRYGYSLAIQSPFPLSQMTATVPVTSTWTGNTKWTKDTRYREQLHVFKVDPYHNIIDYEERAGVHTYAFFGYKGSKLLGTFQSSNGIPIYSPAYTSFEKETMRNAIDDYHTTNVVRDHDSWLPIGTWSEEQAFTGRYSFSGRVRYNAPQYFIQGAILVAALAGGNAPSLERYSQETDTYTPLSVTPTVVAEYGSWKIYRFSYSNAGAIITINTNGNYIDELRMGAREMGDDQTFTTYTWVGGHLTDITNNRFQRKKFGYDEFGRKRYVLDNNGKVLERFQYQFYHGNQ
jgi:hypothetical protein